MTFDATLLKQGEDEMQLTVPAGDVTTGVVYDYLRLELNEDYKARCQLSMTDPFDPFDPFDCAVACAN